jgi:hypothetical protein
MAAFKEVSHIKLMSAFFASTRQFTHTAHYNFYCWAVRILSELLKLPIHMEGEKTIVWPCNKMQAARKSWALSCPRRAHLCQDSGILPTAQTHHHSSRPAERPVIRHKIPELRRSVCSTRYIVMTTRSRPIRILCPMGEAAKTLHILVGTWFSQNVINYAQQVTEGRGARDGLRLPLMHSCHKLVRSHRVTAVHEMQQLTEDLEEYTLHDVKGIIGRWKNYKSAWNQRLITDRVNQTKLFTTRR